mmetsp:Transcript_5367/g.11225  ORF Transcript_5367/g.11225 Transcript_5367/m.11225 type:complete len:215 (+) Transcript_5367:199-843(+)
MSYEVCQSNGTCFFSFLSFSPPPPPHHSCTNLAASIIFSLFSLGQSFKSSSYHPPSPSSANFGSYAVPGHHPHHPIPFLFSSLLFLTSHTLALPLMGLYRSFANSSRPYALMTLCIQTMLPHCVPYLDRSPLGRPQCQESAKFSPTASTTARSSLPDTASLLRDVSSARSSSESRKDAAMGWSRSLGLAAPTVIVCKGAPLESCRWCCQIQRDP